MELLIYFVPVFAGIIGSRYLSRLTNFIVMMLVFELGIGLGLGMSSPWAFIFTPYTPLFILPAVAGMIGDKYFGNSKYIVGIGSRFFDVGKLANALLIIATFYVGGVLLAYQSRGRLIPFLFLQAIFVSAGFLIPPLVFILVAIFAYRLRLRWHVVEETGNYSIRDDVNHSGH